MSGKQKALLILLGVALVVLLVIAIGANSGKKQGNASEENSFVDFLAKFGAKNSAVDPATVTADCTKVQAPPNTYQFTGSCNLTVADPGGLKILIIRGSKFHAEAPAPAGADFEVGADATPTPPPVGRHEAKIAVDKETVVELDCEAGFGQTCTITIAAE